ncbi:hypothetical protein LNV23_21825 [Paucibacter sp. DJ1R-11]|uniref:hypothetical protein n=1 Tax=Paucibacter sp. DJ1R-11 TaxID=2893556 RepID=UPI0021E4F3A2|nr:hypothetical protein [Paucibacter sp. DJ1R-11]MCV2366087.1 hypothetical protein [Paucibacter sp. DJ1R-11]
MTIHDLQELKAALDLYATQYSATDKLWAYFSSVTLAVLGFSVASDKVSKSFVEATIVVAGYVLFCIGNFGALILSHRQLVEFAALVRPIAERLNSGLTTLTPLSTESVSYFYWMVVSAVCAGILFITWRRRPKENVN